MKTAAQSRQTTPQSSPTSSRAVPSTSQAALTPWFRMQRTIGNQALAGLFASGRIQRKLKAISPSDSDQESDLNPRPIFRFPSTPVIRRKCACGGSCAKCAAEEEETRAPRLQLSPVSSRLQRAARDAVGQPEATAVPESDRGPILGLIIEDEASIGSPRQMKKSAFFALLEADICATADAELAAVGRSSNSCPYIRKWMAFYREQSAAHIERSLLKYAPEAADANTARDYIVVVRHRVRRAVALWARTSRVTGIPPGVGLMPYDREGADGTKEGGESTKKDEGFGTGLPRAVSTAGRAQLKEREWASTRATDAESVRDQLGHGRALDSRTRSRMESAFGSDFSFVRVHDDSSSWGLSSQLNARAFTVGSDVAFGAGEYRPGTLVGDALIAHELAHVVQQGAASQSNAPLMKGDGDYDALEAEADVSAVGAVASLWAGAKGKLADIGKKAPPRLKSGLKLQRCQEVEKVCPKGYSWRVQNTTGIGSFGCLCHWKCMPGEDPREIPYDPQSSISCDPNYYCDTGKKREELDSSYTKTGYGAAMTPLGEQAYCGCFPLNKDGKKVSDSPLKATDFEMTDVVGPLADVAAAKRAGAKPQLDPTTGKPIPGKSSPEVEHDVKPKVTVTGDLGVDVAVGNARAAEYRGKFDVGKRRNVAFADYNVEGQKGTLVGVSGEAEREGTVAAPASPGLPTLITGHTREFDSEKKIMEKLTTTIGDNPNASGTIYLFSERDVCAGCDLAIAAFRAKYPKIEVRVVSGKK
jgi:Domain of unknown function (DUF4157)/The  BURPS668_1122 family of deaminases